MTADAALTSSTFRLINDGQRLAVHRVAIDGTGAIVAWDPEPVKLEAPADLGEAARWRVATLAFGAANCTALTEPVLLMRDGKLIEIAAHGGDDAEPVRMARPALAAA